MLTSGSRTFISVLGISLAWMALGMARNLHAETRKPIVVIETNLTQPKTLDAMFGTWGFEGLSMQGTEELYSLDNIGKGVDLGDGALSIQGYIEFGGELTLRSPDLPLINLDFLKDAHGDWRLYYVRNQIPVLVDRIQLHVHVSGWSGHVTEIQILDATGSRMN